MEDFYQKKTKIKTHLGIVVQLIEQLSSQSALPKIQEEEEIPWLSREDMLKALYITNSDLIKSIHHLSDAYNNLPLKDDNAVTTQLSDARVSIELISSYVKALIDGLA